MDQNLSRRTVLSVAGLSLGAILTGCSQNNTPSPSASTTKSAAAVAGGKPQSGGVLKAAFVGQGATETLHPHRSTYYVDGSRNKAIFDRLVEFGSDFKLQPRLATAWEANKDLTEWRISLAEATFHDGSPVKASDVLDTLAAIQADDKAAAGRAVAAIKLANSKAIDDRTVLLATSTPDAELMDALAEYGTQILPQGKTDPNKPIGSGPFTVESFEPGRRTVLVRNDNYWGTKAHLDGLEYHIANDETARINALTSGQMHYIADLGETSVRTLSKNNEIAMLVYPRSAHRAFAMKCDRPPFNDVRVRQAIKLLIDREELHKIVLQGTGEVANDLYGMGQQYYNTHLNQRTRDVAAAKKLLADAGVPDLTFTIDVTDGVPGLSESAVALADHVKEAGVTMKINNLPYDDYWSHTKTKGVMSGYGGGAMTVGQHLRTRVLPDARSNYPQWKDPRMADLYAKAQQTGDEAERTKIYHELQKIHFDDGGHIIWGVGNQNAAASTKVGGMDTKAPANTLEWARFDTAWLAA